LARHGFYPKRSGYLAVLNGPEALERCESLGAAIESRLGSGYTHDTRKGRVRVHTRVKTTPGGFWKEAKTHALRNYPGGS